MNSTVLSLATGLLLSGCFGRPVQLLSKELKTRLWVGMDVALVGAARASRVIPRLRTTATSINHSCMDMIYPYEDWSI